MPITPEIIKARLEQYEALKQLHPTAIQADGAEIEVTLWDETKITVPRGTLPVHIARDHRVNTNECVACRVNDTQWNLTEPLRESCTLQLIRYGEPEGMQILRHSAAHCLGAVLETEFGALLTSGPANESDFHYDSYIGDDHVFTAEDVARLQKAVETLAGSRLPFEFIDVTKEEALSLFAYNEFKVEFIEKATGDNYRVFRVGDFVDFCMGPHVPNTRYFSEGLKLMKNSIVHWVPNDPTSYRLQRVYGVAFGTKVELRRHLEWLAQMEARDHVKVGEKQGLVMRHVYCPGCPIFLPHGSRIYNALESYIRSMYWRYGYEEVKTPTFFNVQLWRESGHWDHYQNDMYGVVDPKRGDKPGPDGDIVSFGVKPMNCPSHCLIFKNTTHTIHDLPIRVADFGELHRNERHDTLRGLTRVRRFHQDDAHIFCARSQIVQEAMGVLRFINEVYDLFGFSFDLGLSTRPAERLGDDSVWDEAEAALREVLDNYGRPYVINEGDGAFYGPKVDIQLKDALGRTWQCATLQLDYNLPERFKLKYTYTDSETGEVKTERPVMIHRAVLGSIERFMAILIESLADNWPFWVSPRQVMIIPARDECMEYAQKVHQMLKEQMFYADIDTSGDRLPKCVLKAKQAGYNYSVILGPRELKNQTVTLRPRVDRPMEGGTKDGVEMTVDQLCAFLHKLRETRQGV